MADSAAATALDAPPPITSGSAAADQPAGSSAELA
eukprot:COSAG06_NODE_61609_length_267_cov_0.619048_1_plen_34_part_10